MPIRRIPPKSPSWSWPTDSPARERCREAARRCRPLLPQPTSYITHLGMHLREVRLASECAEYDLRLRLAEGRAASLDELTCLGAILIETCDGAPPGCRASRPEEMLVNPTSFPVLRAFVRDRMARPQA